MLRAIVITGIARLLLVAAMLAGIVALTRPAEAAEHIPSSALIEHALQAADCQPCAFVYESLARFAALCKSARSQVSPCDPAPRRAAALLDCLHREALVGPYQSDLDSVAETLSTGRHNCLTATILYLALCDEFGLKIKAVSMPGHVGCRLEEGRFRFVETTCARWFELSEEAREAHCQRLGLARLIDNEQLLAKVHYNRGLALAGARQYALAAACFESSRLLDPLDAAARENEIAARNNSALASAQSGDLVAAARQIRLGLALAPDSPLLRSTAKYLGREERNKLTTPGL